MFDWTKKIFPSLLILFVLTIFNNSLISAGRFPLVVKDDTGVSIRIDQLPQRIVSLAPNMTEILFSVGAGKRVVGVTDNCDYPSEVRKIDRVGGIQIQVESVMALKPDLVVANADVQPGIISQIRSVGLRVAAFRPDRWKGVLDTLQRIGSAVGNPTQAEKVIKIMEKRRRVVESTVGKRSKVRVFVEVWNKPLMTAGPGTFLHELVQMAGGEDIAGDLSRPWSIYPTELVLTRNPEVIILTCKNRREVMNRAGWASVEAVRSGRVYEVDPSTYSRPGPRLADALEDLADLLHKKGSGRP